MINEITNFLKSCPHISDYILTADFLGEKSDCIGVFLKSSEPLIEQYADGGALKQSVFCLSCRSTNHETKPGAIFELFYRVAAWLESTEELPALGMGCTAQRFEVLKNGAMAERSYDTSRYDMECRLIYYSEKGSET